MSEQITLTRSELEEAVAFASFGGHDVIHIRTHISEEIEVKAEGTEWLDITEHLK